MPSEKINTKYQLVGYGGLTSTKHLIVPYFPSKIIRFIEPFAGLGRITEMVQAEEYFLNDMSDYAVQHLREKFPSYHTEQIDYVDFIKKHTTHDSFVFCDPPWRKNIYKNNEKPAFTEKNIIAYYEKLLDLLPQLDCKWIITSDRDEHENGHRLQKSGYKNITMSNDSTGKFFGRSPAVRLCGNCI